MMATLTTLYLLAVESHGIPGSDWRAKIAVPLGLVIFVGGVYMLVRANLGTRRGYLVMATSLWGFMVIYALFWTFGAPGTPPATGPQNLPGQQLDAYEDTWRPFAGDSLTADDPDYQVVKGYPEGFSESPDVAGRTEEFVTEAETGADEILTFFSTQAGPLTDPPLEPTWMVATDTEGDEQPEPGAAIQYAQAGNNRPIIAVPFAPTYQVASRQPADADEPVLTVDGAPPADDGSNVAPPGTEIGEIVPEAEPLVFFAYFDAGSPLFPSLVMLGIVSLLFALHALLLFRDENRERRERETVVVEERQPVSTGV